MRKQITFLVLKLKLWKKCFELFHVALSVSDFGCSTFSHVGVF